MHRELALSLPRSNAHVGRRIPSGLARKLVAGCSGPRRRAGRNSPSRAVGGPAPHRRTRGRGASGLRTSARGPKLLSLNGLRPAGSAPATSFLASSGGLRVPGRAHRCQPTARSPDYAPRPWGALQSPATGPPTTRSSARPGASRTLPTTPLRRTPAEIPATARLPNWPGSLLLSNGRADVGRVLSSLWIALGGCEGRSHRNGRGASRGGPALRASRAGPRPRGGAAASVPATSFLVSSQGFPHLPSRRPERVVLGSPVGRTRLRTPPARNARRARQRETHPRSPQVPPS
jgi:hypothetical protein